MQDPNLSLAEPCCGTHWTAPANDNVLKVTLSSLGADCAHIVNKRHIVKLGRGSGKNLASAHSGQKPTSNAVSRSWPMSHKPLSRSRASSVVVLRSVAISLTGFVQCLSGAPSAILASMQSYG